MIKKINYFYTVKELRKQKLNKINGQYKEKYVQGKATLLYR